MKEIARNILIVEGRPKRFFGRVFLPPSKSYLHRALFIASLAKGESKITGCGNISSDDIQATENVLKSLGVIIRKSAKQNGTTLVRRSLGIRYPSKMTLDARGSGTTARFLIPFVAALTPNGTRVRITGNESLSKRPMGALLKSLSELGARVKSEKHDGQLPVIVEGGRLKGGSCWVDGSISSQFLSAMLIASTTAMRETNIQISKPEELVSKPYLQATLAVLSSFGFDIGVIGSKECPFTGFLVPGNQTVKARSFRVPGDMSAAASLIGVSVASGGTLTLSNCANTNLPQSDSSILPILRKFGVAFKNFDSTLKIASESIRLKKQKTIKLDLHDSPDLVPVIAGLAAATGTQMKIGNIAHLRYKESDRISVISRELRKLGVFTKEYKSSLFIKNNWSHVPIRKPILLDPEKDHRMLIALTIAGLSGRFGEIRIQDPECVMKSYPRFIDDLHLLCHEKMTVRLAHEFLN